MSEMPPELREAALRLTRSSKTKAPIAKALASTQSTFDYKI